MGKKDIESWAAQTTTMEEDYEESSQMLSWQQALGSWPEFITHARKTLLSSKTKSRILFIEDELIPLWSQRVCHLKQTYHEVKH